MKQLIATVQAAISSVIFVRCLVRLSERNGTYAGSRSTNKGRLEVFYQGTWGTVCNDHFSDVDAKVFCNQLGFG